MMIDRAPSPRQISGRPAIWRGILTAIIFGLSGCSGLQGEWPSLTLPKQELAKAAQAVEPLAPVDVPAPVEKASGPSAVLTDVILSDLEEKLTALGQRADTQIDVLERAVVRALAEPKDKGLWSAAQLNLSRLSQIASALTALEQDLKAPLAAEPLSLHRARLSGQALSKRLALERLALQAQGRLETGRPGA